MTQTATQLEEGIKIGLLGHFTVVVKYVSYRAKQDIQFIVSQYAYLIDDDAHHGSMWSFGYLADKIREKHTDYVGIRRAEWLRRFDSPAIPGRDRCQEAGYRLPALIYYSEVVWPRLRLTRPIAYPPGSPGFGNAGVGERQGYWIENTTVLDAVMKMREDFPSEIFDVQFGNNTECYGEEEIWEYLSHNPFQLDHLQTPHVQIMWAKQYPFRSQCNGPRKPKVEKWAIACYEPEHRFQPDYLYAPCCRLTCDRLQGRAYRPSFNVGGIHA